VIDKQPIDLEFRKDHQLQELVPAKVLAAAPVKDAKLDEALAKECQTIAIVC
jgi:siroheme synthase (precorrin-2 oxidase/ferrochelatase)